MPAARSRTPCPVFVAPWSSRRRTASCAQTWRIALNYAPGIEAQSIFEAHRFWGQHHADPLPAVARAAADRSPARRLRVGYVSAYFREHAISVFTEPMRSGPRSWGIRSLLVQRRHAARHGDPALSSGRRSLDRYCRDDRSGPGQTHRRRSCRHPGRSHRALGRQSAAGIRPPARADSSHVHRLSEHDRHASHGLSVNRCVVGSAGHDRSILHRKAGAAAAGIFLLSTGRTTRRP